LAAVIGARSTPSQPKWSIVSAAANWPASVAALRPPTPSARMVQTIEPT
jgi:hypothetical protein